jgi:signal transduction histidine kinase
MSVLGWYQTPWLYGLFTLLVAAVLTGLYRRSRAQPRADTRRLLEVRLSERTRIAHDLHDTLLQGFHGLMFQLEAIRQLLPERPGDAAKLLDSAIRVGDRAIGEGREAVQRLHSSSTQHLDLATSLGALGNALGAQIEPRSRPRYRVVVQGRPRALRAVVRDQAYRVAREAVRNAYQHAKADHIAAKLIFGDAHLAIRIRDDGIGMDRQILASGQRDGHWGLPGMRERTESIGGRLDICSAGKAGTTVELRIPAGAAYAQSPTSEMS